MLKTITKNHTPYEQITSIDFWSATDSTKRAIYHQIINSEENGSYPRYPYKFFFKEDKQWIGVDNTEHCCWVKEFGELSEAITWLNDIKI